MMETLGSNAVTLSRDHRQLLLPEVFSGDGSFEEWTDYFESVAAVNRWDDSEKVLWLRMALTGKACVAYKRLSHETRKSYRDSTLALSIDTPPSSRVEYLCFKRTIRAT